MRDIFGFGGRPGGEPGLLADGRSKPVSSVTGAHAGRTGRRSASRGMVGGRSMKLVELGKPELRGSAGSRRRERKFAWVPA